MGFARTKLGIQCKQKRKFKVTTDSSHSFAIAHNVLGQKFTATAPNQIWVSDITYIPTDEGWLYLAGNKDLFSGDLAGYAMSERMSRNLISQSLFRGVTEKRPAKGLIHHRRFATRAEAKQAISEYIEIFYKRQRKQARLNYRSPVAFERLYYDNKRVA